MKTIDFGHDRNYNLIMVKKRQALNGKETKTMEVMESMGMTDLQFKSYLKRLIRSLEAAESQDTREAVIAEIEKLKQDLQEDLQG